MKYRALQISVVLFVLCGNPSQAQERGVRMGNWSVYPVVGLSFGYDDNVALATNVELDSFFYRVSPALRLEKSSRRSHVQIEYSADYADYEVSDFDDYLDQELAAEWRYDPTARVGMHMSASFARGHDRRGEGLREGLIATLNSEVDEYDRSELGAFFGYGAPGSRGRFELSLAHADKSYKNNRDFTRDGDFQVSEIATNFYLRVAPKTRALLRLLARDIDYALADRDGDEQAYYAGLTWDATGKTEGRVLYGAIDRDFDTQGRAGYSGSSWEMGITWTPRSYTIIDIATSRRTDEAFGASDLLVRDEFEMSWRQQWRPRFFTVLDLSRADEDFRPGPRNDEIEVIGLSAGYQFRRWMSIGLGWQHHERASTLDLFDYNRNEVLLSVELSL